MWQDKAISKWVLENISQRYEWTGSIAKFLSDFNSWGQMWLLIMLGLMVYEYFKNKKINPYFLLAMIPILLGWVLSEHGIKFWVARPRPYQEIPEFQEYMDQINYKYPSHYSFPSGHTLIAFAAAFTLAKYNKKYLPYGYVLAILIAFSRIILGAHYFSDVLAGAGLGTLFGVLGCLFANYFPRFVSFIKNKISKKDSTNAS